LANSDEMERCSMAAFAVILWNLKQLRIYESTYEQRSFSDGDSCAKVVNNNEEWLHFPFIFIILFQLNSERERDGSLVTVQSVRNTF
jgi:hypothetical protein